MSDYQVVKKLLEAERRRREGVYRFRPMERGAAMKEIGDALGALERMKKAGEWKTVGKWWQEKFD
jgi:hypothetical protein